MLHRTILGLSKQLSGQGARLIPIINLGSRDSLLSSQLQSARGFAGSAFRSSQAFSARQVLQSPSSALMGKHRLGDANAFAGCVQLEVS